MMSDYQNYTISIKFGNFEGEDCFQAKVKELPDVEEYADTYDEAYMLAHDTIETTAAIFQKKGKAMPSALEEQEDFSGRITLRVPKSLHKTLVGLASTDGVSLNQYIVNTLSYDAGFSRGLKSNEAGAWVRRETPMPTQIARHRQSVKRTPIKLTAVA
jgi:predicted HicB family RNase H-like nuclease